MMKLTQDDNIDAVAEGLQRGEVIVCPTDTVYGLLADATNEEAVEKVFKVKGREKRKPLPVFVKDMHMAKELAHISKEQEEFLEKAWPGKVTAILESKQQLPEGLEVDGKIALRIPDYELVNTLLKRLGRPLTGTSANISGEPSCRSAVEAMSQFEKQEHRPDIVVNAGTLPKSRASAIIDITQKEHAIVRE
jgi:L-threonylcarbamoyladenylate synthase